MQPGLVVVLVLSLAIGIRLIAGSLDGDRLESYLRQRGAKLRSRKWSPFGRGWFGERNARIYEIEYEDRDGNVRAATVKTSMFSGVYLTDDRLVRRSAHRAAPNVPATQPADDVERLRAENARLKAELTRRS